MEDSEEVLLEPWRQRPLSRQIGDRLARWLSPLL
jgi:hypothetical protein